MFVIQIKEKENKILKFKIWYIFNILLILIEFGKLGRKIR